MRIFFYAWSDFGKDGYRGSLSDSDKAFGRWTIWAELKTKKIILRHFGGNCYPSRRAEFNENELERLFEDLDA